MVTVMVEPPSQPSNVIAKQEEGGRRPTFLLYNTVLSCLLLLCRLSCLQDFLPGLGVFCFPTDTLEGDLFTAEMVRLARRLEFLWRKVLVLVSS